MNIWIALLLASVVMLVNIPCLLLGDRTRVDQLLHLGLIMAASALIGTSTYLLMGG